MSRWITGEEMVRRIETQRQLAYLLRKYIFETGCRNKTLRRYADTFEENVRNWDGEAA